MPVVSAFGRWKQDDQDFKVILGYINFKLTKADFELL